MEAVRLGFVKLFVPFLFVSMPGLLMVGNGLDVTLSAVFATIGIVGLTIAFAGWFVRPMSAFERGALAVAALLVVWPTAVTSLDVLTVAMRLIGIAGLLALLIRLFVARPTPLESEV